MREYKPSYRPFVVFSLLRYLVIYAIILAVVVVYFRNASAFIIAAGIYVVLSVFTLMNINVMYRKECYSFQKNTLVRRSGTLFSDRKAELNIRNITHVRMVLPYLENEIFRTGSISIESAGADIVELAVLHVEDPEKMYQIIQGMMKDNGFSLVKKRLIQEEQPSLLGVFLNVAKTAAGTIFGIFFFWLLPFYGFMDILRDNLLIALIVFMVFLVYIFVRNIFLFLDLQTRVYRVYDDVLTFEEGFLTKRFSFIPLENLSDVKLSQDFVSRIFGIYDIILSCQGSRQEIDFSNIRNGETMQKNIDMLVKKTKSLSSMASKKKEEARYKAEFRMDPRSALLPYVIWLALLPILFIWPFLWFLVFVPLLGFGRKALRCAFTTYHLKERSTAEKYEFLTRDQAEFSFDKVTAIVFHENLIDKLFGTYSIEFWSIGAGQNLTFSHIPKDSGLKSKILAKAGIKHEKMIYNMDSAFSFVDMLKAALPLSLLSATAVLGLVIYSFIDRLALLAVPLIVAAYIIIVNYKSMFYGRCRLVFYKSYLEFFTGVLITKHHFVLNSNIKGLTTLQYPWSEKGSITFNVAGEQVIRQQGKSQGFVSNAFTMRYAVDMRQHAHLVGSIIDTGKTIEQPARIILSAKPVCVNYMLPLVIGAVLLFPLLPLTVPLIIYAYYRVKSTTYHVEGSRVVKKTGVWYKKQVSVLFKMIDHITHSQNALNKMFDNGNVNVNTTGSSKIELTLANMREYKEFYDALRKHYK